MGMETENEHRPKLLTDADFDVQRLRVRWGIEAARIATTMGISFSAAWTLLILMSAESF